MPDPLERCGAERLRSNWESDPGGLHVCMRLVEITPPFDAGQKCELKFDLSPCHGLLGGQLSLQIAPDDAKLYFVGDEFSIRIRLI